MWVGRWWWREVALTIREGDSIHTDGDGLNMKWLFGILLVVEIM